MVSRSPEMHSHILVPSSPLVAHLMPLGIPSVTPLISFLHQTLFPTQFASANPNSDRNSGSMHPIASSMSSRDSSRQYRKLLQFVQNPRCMPGVA